MSGEMRALQLAGIVLGVMFCMGVVVDAFQTIILPRRPSRKFRITRLFYMLTWKVWCWKADSVRDKKVREEIYSVYGPLSLLLLLILWASMLVVGLR